MSLHFRANGLVSLCFHTHSGFERISLTSFFLVSSPARLFPSATTSGRSSPFPSGEPANDPRSAHSSPLDYIAEPRYIVKTIVVHVISAAQNFIKGISLFPTGRKFVVGPSDRCLVRRPTPRRKTGRCARPTATRLSSCRSPAVQPPKRSEPGRTAPAVRSATNDALSHAASADGGASTRADRAPGHAHGATESRAHARRCPPMPSAVLQKDLQLHDRACSSVSVYHLTITRSHRAASGRIRTLGT